MTTPVRALHDDRTPLLTVAKARATPWRVLAAIFVIACVAGAGVLAVRTSIAHGSREGTGNEEEADESQSPLVGGLHRSSALSGSADLGGAIASSGNAIVSCSLCSGCQGTSTRAKCRRAVCELLQSGGSSADLGGCNKKRPKKLNKKRKKRKKDKEEKASRRGFA
jgi:hypothetical protein